MPEQPELRAGDRFAILSPGAVSRQGGPYVETRLQLTYEIRQSTPEEVIELIEVRDAGAEGKLEP